ncbi:GNAT family N-acetyltransferase [Halomicronema sp. CCY15110]|uniref:GNAT family N-acetyltransferase n=1 Tax=Halomicronema sp. CCY15110 TaxID=2767773 RepID=UPI001EF23E5C|nr:GNAT family N-acetyltransferase [Halomicronema sp. CCY15110]
MTREDLDLAINWAAAEGWNPGLHDADCFYAADPSGFFMGWLDDEPIAAISVVKYGASFGFLGFYMVRPEFRGRGYGWQLWQAGLATLKGRTVGLDGVVDQQSNYLKSGFQLAYRNIRYEGWGDGQVAPPPEAIVPLSSLPPAQIIEYDRPLFPDDRTAFLRCWLTQPESVALGYLEGQALVGYGVLRPCRQGYKIGPLFADTPAIADPLFQQLKAHVPAGEPVYLDVPEVNAAAVALAQRYGLTSMFETARMYLPAVPVLPCDRIFGVTTFELG